MDLPFNRYRWALSRIQLQSFEQAIVEPSTTLFKTEMIEIHICYETKYLCRKIRLYFWVFDTVINVL